MVGLQFIGTNEPDDETVTYDEMMLNARDVAQDELESMVAPARRTHRVHLDTDDAAHLAMVDIAQGGDLGKAIAMADGRLEQDPNNPAVLYNKAVFVDATGDYATALELYDAAIEHNVEDGFYRDARNGCFKRNQAARALNE